MKNIIFGIASLVALAFATSLISGCIVFCQGRCDYAYVAPCLEKSWGKQIATYNVALSMERNDLFSHPTEGSLSSAIEYALRRTEVFDNVQRFAELDGGDYRFEFKFRQTGTTYTEAALMGLISGVTLTFIPTTEKYVLVGMVDVYKDGKRLISSKRSEVCRVVTWLPMLPFGLFNTSDKAWRKVETQLVAALVSETVGLIKADLEKQSVGNIRSKVVDDYVISSTNEAISIDRINVDGFFGLEFGRDIGKDMCEVGLIPEYAKNDKYESYDLGHPLLEQLNPERRVNIPETHNFMDEFVPWVLFATRNGHELAAIKAVSDMRMMGEIELNKKAFAWRDKFTSMGMGEPKFSTDPLKSVWRWEFVDAKHRACYAALVINRPTDKIHDQLKDRKYRSLYFEIGLLPCIVSNSELPKQGQDAGITGSHVRGALNLFEGAKDKLVIISVKNKGDGSGFLAEENGRVYLYTNEHVTRMGDPFVARLLSGEKLTLGEFQIAENEEIDLARFELPTNIPAFKIAKKIPNIGDAVAVLGNSDGCGVSTEISGIVLGVGPSIVETNAGFVRGNSGSPLLDKNGEVIGVATYAIKLDQDDWTRAGTRFADVRRFATRIDHVKWQSIPWNVYLRFRRDK